MNWKGQLLTESVFQAVIAVVLMFAVVYLLSGCVIDDEIRITEYSGQVGADADPLGLDVGSAAIDIDGCRVTLPRKPLPPGTKMRFRGDQCEVDFDDADSVK